MKIVKVESNPHLKSSVQLLDLEKTRNLLSDQDESEWKKWEPEPEKPKEIGATIISPRVAESTAACYLQPEAKKLKANIQKQQKSTEPVINLSNVVVKQKLPVKIQKEIIKKGPTQSSKPAFNCPPSPKVCNPQSFKKLLQNPNLEVQLVQPGKSPQIVSYLAKTSIPSEGGAKYNNGNKSSNKNGNGALISQGTPKPSTIQVTKISSPGQNNKLNTGPVQPPKLVAESLQLNQKLAKSLGRDPPQLLRETNFPNQNVAGGIMRGRPQSAGPTSTAPNRGRGRAVPIPSKPSPEKLAAQLLEQNKLMLDKKQGTYKGRGRPPKTTPKIGRGDGANNAGGLGRQSQGDEGTYVAPKPPPGSNPSNGKDLPPPKGLPPQRAPTKPIKPSNPKEKVPPPKAHNTTPVKTSPNKSKVNPFPSKQPQSQQPPTKNATSASTPTSSVNSVSSVKGQPKGAPTAPKATVGKGGETKTTAAVGGACRPAPFLTRVTESSEAGEKSEVSPGAGASYECPDMDAKAFYFEKGVKFWVCLVCNKEEPEISTTPMICCDTCDDWYHFSCVGIDDEPSDDESWFCKRCIVRNKEAETQAQNATKIKPKTAMKTKAKQPLPPPKAPKKQKV